MLVTLFDLPNPDATPTSTDLVDKLEDINQTLITLTKVINKFNQVNMAQQRISNC